MKKRQILLILFFFCFFFLIKGTNPANSQVQAYVTVGDTSLISGDTYQQITVYLQNDVPIKGIELMFTLGHPAITDFTTERVNIQVDSSGIPWDTSTVRHCKIQTAGTLVENFEWVKAQGEVGDTAFLDCDWVKVAGMAYEGDPIPPGSGVLLKLYLDVLCIPDTTQDRTAHIVLNGFISDPNGQLVTTEFNFGTLYLEQTWCGNLLDCKCGDVNTDGKTSIVDVVYMINWLFNDGPPLCPELSGDVNQVKGVSIADVVYLINYIFNDGASPICIRKY